MPADRSRAASPGEGALRGLCAVAAPSRRAGERESRRGGSLGEAGGSQGRVRPGENAFESVTETKGKPPRQKAPGGSGGRADLPRGWPGARCDPARPRLPGRSTVITHTLFCSVNPSPRARLLILGRKKNISCLLCAPQPAIQPTT